LRSPPKRKETILRKISTELLLPDFFFFSEHVPIEPTRFPDFRLTTPSMGGYARETLRWMDLATAIQNQADKIADYDPSKSIKAIIPTNVPIDKAARVLRNTLEFSHDVQLTLPTSSALFAWLRQRIEKLNVFVLQLSFPSKDGAGFCLAGAHYDVIVINTRRQPPPRRIFTLAHEIYHCALGKSGVSDPFVIHNPTERRCNTFAAEFLAPPETSSDDCK
jgi:hypothetical protein